MSKWIECSERMPPKMMGVLVCTGDSQVHEGYYFVDTDSTPVWKIYCYRKLYVNGVGVVTHWMPLPAPPSLV